MNTLITYNPISVGPASSLGEIVRLLDEWQVRHLPVVDDEFRLLGMISDLDVANHIAACAEAETDDENGEPREATAGDLMARDVKAVEHDLPPLVALRTMLTHEFHSVPVTDRGRLTGIVTTQDFLREFTALAPGVARSPTAKIMSPWKRSIDAADSPATALRLLAGERNGFLGVSAGLRAVGVMSKRRLRAARRLEPIVAGDCRASDHWLMTAAESVGDLLPEEPAVVPPLRPAGEAAATMLDRKLDALAVVDADGRPQGMLTEFDLLQAMSLTLARRA